MSRRYCRIFYVLILIVLLGSVYCVELENQPKIHTADNGKLIIEAAKDRNISFNLMQGSTLLVNDVDIYDHLNQLWSLKSSKSSELEEVNIFQDSDREDFKNQLDELRTNFERFVTRLANLGRNTRTQRQNITRSLARIRRLRRQFTSLEVLLTKDQCQADISGTSPCKNGGICYNVFPKFHCDCPEGWSGKTCEEDVDECHELAGTDLGCQNNAFCENTRGSYRCKCRQGYYGTHCRTASNACESGEGVELCGHGVCVHASNGFGYACICDAGWTKNNATPACSVDVNECQEDRNPCHGECINLPGSFKCGSCPEGYLREGLLCRDINECASENGGCSQQPLVRCINTEGSSHCGQCPQGYTGDGRQCEQTPSNSCDNEQICHVQAKCEYISDTVVCTCPIGMFGHGFGVNGCTNVSKNNPCDGHECKNNGTCVVNGRGTICVCPMGYEGYMCERNDACNPSPCQNAGTCSLSAVHGYRCKCNDGSTGRNCEIMREICSSTILEEHGEITYPSDNSTYQGHETCPWIITTDASKILNVTFTRFDVEDSHDCQKDWLQIHDGPSIASQLIGRFCGNELPLGGNILSSHNRMLFWFHSDNATHGGGFKFQWTSQDYVCGDDISITSSGIIKSPGYPGKTPINRECQWRLTAPYGYRVVMRTYEVNLGQRPNCTGDTLKVYDANLELKVFCESETSQVFRSSSNRVLIHLHTDGYRADSSFQMHYEVEHGKPHCGGIFTEPTGIINAYVDATVCLYLIRQPLGTQIQLDLNGIQLSKSISCRFQKLEIFDGDSDEEPLIKRYCGTHDFPEPITSTGNTMLLRYENFYPILPLPNKIQANYKRVCEYRFFGPDNGTVATPNYPQAFLKGLTCTYDLYGPANFGVEVNILDFDMGVKTPNSNSQMTNANPGNLTLENMRMADENLNYLDVIPRNEAPQRYDSNPPMLLTSSSNHMRLVLHMAESIGKSRGMKFDYKFVLSQCGGILTNSEGDFRKLLLADDDCLWTIQAPPDTNIKLHLTLLRFDRTDCANGQHDIFIYDNATANGSGQLLDSYCRVIDIDDVYPTNIITIRKPKRTAGSRIYTRISYEFVTRNETCGGEFKTKFGVIKSPQWPKPYGLSVNCSWHIIAPMGHQIELKVYNFSIETSFFNCMGDYLEIRNGPNENSPVIGKYCGVNIPKRIPSLSNHLYVSFVSDEFFSSEGFYITWEQTATGCGGKLNSHQGSIHSPHNVAYDMGEVACSWEIIVAQGSTVILTLLGGSFCSKRHALTIYDGVSGSANKLEPDCAIERSSYTLESTGNKVLLRYVVNNDTVDSMPFVVDYTTNCHMTLNGLQGVIESPNFPDNYPPNMSCAWEIRASGKDKISLVFSHLKLERGFFDCTYDYIDIVDMQNDVVLSEQRMCRLPTEMITTQGNRAILKFVSDHSRSHMGFRLEYKRQGCGEHLYETSGTFSTPDAPYSIGMDCEWYIEVAAGYQIYLIFSRLEIDTDTRNCSNDGILIRESKTSQVELFRECIVNDMAVSLTSPANRLYVNFYASDRRSKKYFMASYRSRKAVCGGRYKTDSGFIASPSFYGSIQGGIKCQWNIDVERGFGIELKFNEFNITQSPNCTTDYLEIRKITDNQEIILERACGLEAPNIKLIHGNYASITLQLSDKGWGKFSLNYAKQCGGVLTSPSGFIKSRPGEYCSWYIMVTTGSYFSLDILNLECQEGQQTDIKNGLVISNSEDEKNATLELCKEHHSLIMIPTTNLYVAANNIKLSAKYSTVQNSCGGEINGLRGFIASPLYPQEYPANIECIWKIIAQDTYLEISLMELDIRPSDNCNEDFLEVRTSESEELVGLFCGTGIPDEPIRLFERAWIKFRSIDTGTGKGFKLKYNLAHENELNGERGTITSPPLFGVADEEPYTWRIWVSPENNIQLNFFEYSRGLQLYDGFDESALAVDILYSPWTFNSSSNAVYLKTDNANIEAFSVAWQSMSKEVIAGNTTIRECRETITLGYRADVNLSSPGYPKEYKAELDCEWIVKVDDIGQHAVLKLYEVDLEESFECYADYVRVWISSDLEEWTSVLHECQLKLGGIKDVREIHGTPYLKVEFHSDNMVSRRGFTSILSAACGSNITTSVGKISLPMSLQSPSCLWNIAVRPGRRISMNVNIMKIGQRKISCSTYAIIYDGVDEHAPLLPPGRICQNNVHLVSTANQITLRYNQEVAYLINGTFNFTFREMNTCNDEIRLTDHLPSVNISSPRYPNVPQPHTECNWIIIAPVGEILEANFVDRFDMNTRFCNLEYVEFYDGSTSLARNLGKYCRKPRNSIRSTNNILNLHYLTGITEPRNGFRVNVSISKCGHAFTNVNGVIHSKNYPQLDHNPKSAFCDYTIRLGVQGSLIRLNFTDVHIPFDERKLETSDRIEIIVVGNNSTTTTARVIYGNLTTLPLVWEIDANELIVRFYAFSNVNKYRGFMLNYNKISSPCYRTVVGESGQLTVNNDITAQSYRQCVWKITVPKGLRVNLSSNHIDVLNITNNLVFTTFFTSRRKTSTRPRIICYNDFQKNSKITDIDLLNTNTFSVQSSDNLMLVQILSAGRINKIVASYSSDMLSPCPDNIQDSTSGVVYIDESLTSLPTYYCRIQFTLNGQETISFEIQKLNMIFNELSTSYPVIFKDDRVNLPLKEINSNMTSGLLSFSPIRGSLSLFQSEKVRLTQFRVKYQRHKCGGNFYMVDGLSLKKPDISANEYGMIECVWILRFGMGEHKLLGNVTFVDNCDREYIEIYGGFSAPSLITKLCRDNSILSGQILKRNYNMIKYHADNYDNLMFNIDLRVQKTLGCGSRTKVMDMETIDIDRQSYRNNIECSWDFEANTGYYLSVEFTSRFFIEDAVNCSKDYLEIQTYTNGLWLSHDKFCGRNLPQLSIYATALRVIFHTDEVLTGDGFHMIISSDCNVKVNVTQDTQSLIGPQFHFNSECSYEFHTLSNQLIHLEINGSYFGGSDDVDKCDEFKAFTKSGSGNVEKESGTYCIGSEIHAQHYLRLEYKFLRRLKFTITYELDSCGGNITAPSTIYSLVSANKVRNKYCQWNIIAPPQHAIVIRFLHFGLPAYFYCKVRYVAIYEGLTLSADKRIERLCGSLKRDVYIVNSNEAILASMTDFRRSEFGFEAEITFTINCNEHVTLSEDNTVVTIAHNERVNKSEERYCHYYVTAPEGYRVSLIIKSLQLNHISCTSDTCQKCNYIEIFDDINSEKSMGKYCASGKAGYKLYTSYENALIRLYVKDEEQYSFEISAHLEQSVCGGRKEIVLDDFDSKGTTIVFPQGANMTKYPANEHCSWRIISKKPFEIDFTSFLLTNVSQIDGKCTDYLYLSWSTNKFTYLCGNATGHQMTFLKQSKRLTTEMIFHSDQFDEDRGFNLTVRRLRVCDRIYNRLSNRIMLMRSDDNVNCSLDIQVPQSHILTLYMQPCDSLDLKVIDMNKNESLSVDCTENTLSLYTTTNHLHLEAQNTQGEYLNYIASNARMPPGCGGTITTPGITISSPQYDLDHSYSNCRWDFIAPIPNTAAIKFLAFDMGPDANCYLDYVQILEIKADGTEKLVDTLCGSRLPRDFESHSHHIAIIGKKTPNFAGIGWKLQFMEIYSTY